MRGSVADRMVGWQAADRQAGDDPGHGKGRLVHENTLGSRLLLRM